MFSKYRNRLGPFFLLILLIAWGVCRPAGARSGVSSVPPPESVESCPSFENRFETNHFILRWTNMSDHPEDNISDPALIEEAAGYFETAWEKYTALFHREPYAPPGTGKIEVIFKSLECYAYADPPDGPIELNSAVWTSMPSIRPTTCAHELFHKLQYAYGYKTRWAPRPPVQWFTEGTAAWAEVFVCGRVTRNCKLEDMFTDVGLDLYEAEDMALPFWIYFVSGNSDTPRDRLMVDFFEKYEKTGDAKRALFEVIRSAYGHVDRFFSRFALERKNGFWHDPAPGCRPYARILGPEGKDLVAEIKEYQGKGRGRSPRPSEAEGGFPIRPDAPGRESP